jgi:hypothetical protein
MALKISQLTPVAVGSLDGSEPIELGIAGDKNAPNGAFLSPGHIDGLQMRYVGPASLTVTSGAAYIPSLGRVVRLTAAIAKAGIALTASTFHHVYLYLNAGVPDIEIVTTAPAAAYNGTACAKTGDTSRRYVGSVLTDSAGNILNFAHIIGEGRIVYLVTINNALFQLAINDAALSEATISAASVVPVTARALSAFMENTDTSAGAAYLSSSDVGSPPTSYPAKFIRAKSMLAGDIVLDASLAFTFQTNATAVFSCYATGYTFER